jgi:hypothetical protein
MTTQLYKSCPNCRQTAPTGAGFCPSCGHAYATQFPQVHHPNPAPAKPKTLPIIIAVVIIVCGAAFTYNQVTQARLNNSVSRVMPGPGFTMGTENQKQLDAFNKQIIYGNPEMNREILRSQERRLASMQTVLSNARKAIEIGGRTPEMDTNEKNAISEIRNIEEEIAETKRKLSQSHPHAP